MAKSLSTKYRPKVFEDVVGQSSAVYMLKNQINSRSFKQAYIFHGISGGGKTTVARIFANEVNSGVGKPIEINAASNNSVDNIRDIIESAGLASLDSKHKVYILDEGHRLSPQAFDCLLKLLEEPPEDVIFIICSTELHKIPTTIQNRCQQFNFRRIDNDVIVSRLEYILNEEGIYEYEKEALFYIARLSKGRMRDAISYLETAINYNDGITVRSVLSCLNIVSYEDMFLLLKSLLSKDEKICFNLIENLDISCDLKIFCKQFLNFLIDVRKYQLTRGFNFTDIPNTFLTELINMADMDIRHIIESFVELRDNRYDDMFKLTMETEVMALCR